MIELMPEQPEVNDVFRDTIVNGESYSGFVIVRLQPRFARMSEWEREEAIDHIVSDLPVQVDVERLIDPEVLNPEDLQAIEEIYFPYLPPLDAEEVIHYRASIFELLNITRDGWTPEIYQAFMTTMLELWQLTRVTTNEGQMSVDLLELVALPEFSPRIADFPTEILEKREEQLTRFDQFLLDQQRDNIRVSFDLNEEVMFMHYNLNAENQPHPSAFYSLNTYWRLDMRERDDMSEVLEQLNFQYPELVHTAYAELKVTGSTNPEYLGSEGINADDLHTNLTDISEAFKVNFIDLEQGWDINHPHYAIEPHDLIHGRINSDPLEKAVPHGTAVLGIVIADESMGAPFTGIATPVVRQTYLTSHYNGDSEGHVASALAAVMAKLIAKDGVEAGDIVLLEAQSGFYPVEKDDHNFNKIQLATEAGLVVIEAAGNKGADLDEKDFWITLRDVDVEAFIFNRGHSDYRESGAIIIGAIDPTGADDVESNFGSRIDVNAWGTNVESFEFIKNTSAASAIIAGAALLIQSLNKRENASAVLDSFQMRWRLNGLKLAPISNHLINVDDALGL